MFIESVAHITGDDRVTFERLIAWAEQLAQLPRVRLYSYAGGGGRVTMLPRILPENVGLITMWNDFGKPYVSVWRSVFERIAPNSVERVEKTIAPARLGRGTTVRDLSEEVVEAITAAYREATGG